MDRLRDKKFAEFYKSYLMVISKNYGKLEKMRQDYIKEVKSSGRFLIYGLIILSFFIISCSRSDDIIGITTAISVFFSTFFIVILPIATYFSVNKKYKKNLKAAVAAKLVNINWHYDSKKSIFEPGELENINLFFPYEYVTDDQFSGKYKEVDFKISERRHGSFSNIVLAYKFNKKIKSKTLVSKKSIIPQTDILKGNMQAIVWITIYITLFMTLGLWEEGGIRIPIIIGIYSFVGCMVMLYLPEYFKLRKKYKNPKFKIALEDPKFNRQFNVYSSNEVEARYLVTPAFMEKFYNLKTAFGAKNIRCSFFDDNLMIAIETKRDLFELGNLFKPVRDVKTIERFYNEINAIFEMIDYFKLNEKIYLI